MTICHGQQQGSIKMPVNIPNTQLPFSGLNQAIATGGNLFSQMMNPVIQRENMMRQWKQHLENMALQKQQMAHAARNDDLQRQILQERLTGLHHANDPNYELNKFKSTLGGLNNVDMEALKKNPALRGFFKHQFGFDPLSPAELTPEEKDARALNLFQQKENIKKQNRGGDVPTNSILTQNQNAIQGIDTVVPMIDEIINNPQIVYGQTDFSPSKKAAYNAKTSGMIDTLVAAQSLPKVQASIDLVSEQIRRHTNESTDAYIKRLKDLRKDLINRRGRSQSVLKNRKINTDELEDFSKMSDDELRKIAGGG